MNADLIKYEVDKQSGALFLVLVRTALALLPGVVVRCRAVGALRMEDEAGGDTKLLAVPTDVICPLFVHWKSIDDVPEILERISRFQNLKDCPTGPVRAAAPARHSSSSGANGTNNLTARRCNNVVSGSWYQILSAPGPLLNHSTRFEWSTNASL